LRLKEPAVVEPVDPFEGGVFDRLETAPWPTRMDHLGLVEAVDRLGEGVVVRGANAADRGNHSGVGETLGGADRQILTAPVAVMDGPSPAPGRQAWRACSRASRTQVTCAVRLARQPTMQRAKASMTKAT